MSSPLLVEGLENGEHYTFWIVGHRADGGEVLGASGARPDAIGTNGSVDAFAPGPSETLVFGGNFTEVGVPTGGHGLCLRRESAGTHPCAAVTGGVSANVYAVESDGDGGYYLGGWFDEVGGEPRRNIAHVLADGTVGSWDPGADAEVMALLRMGERLYVGGWFSEIDGESRLGLATFDAEGNLEEWAPDAASDVRALAFDGSRVHVGGWFDAMDGEPRPASLPSSSTAHSTTGVRHWRTMPGSTPSPSTSGESWREATSANEAERFAATSPSSTPRGK